TAAGKGFCHPTQIESTQARQDFEKRLGLGREIETVRTLVIVNSAEPVAVIEQHRQVSAQIDQQSAEPSVPPLYESHPHCLVKGYQVFRTPRSKVTPPALRYFPDAHEIFAREHQANIAAFIP